MKNLITIIPCVTILLVLIMQINQSQIMFCKMACINSIANEISEVVSFEGCVSEDTENNLKEEVAEILGCEQQKIIVSGDRKQKLKGMQVHYKIGIPLSELIELSPYWNSDLDYRDKLFNIERYVISVNGE